VKSTDAIEAPVPTRREFCVRTCRAVSLLTVGSVIQACGGNSMSPSGSAPALPTVNASVANGALTVTIDAASPLASVGATALVQASSGNFLVARTAQDVFTALTAVCTHDGCTVSGFDNQVYVCPCHGSRFTTGGSVVQGPAPSPLRQFSTRFANGILTITT
jgi:cytochrome b6-f complex iron-sulfur subunit